jgi:predicted RecB family nuclease
MLSHSEVFESYIKCPMKCWLLASGVQATGNIVASWTKSRANCYESAVTERLVGRVPREQCVGSVAYEHNGLRLSIEDLKAATWRFAIDVTLSHEVCGRPVAGNEQERDFLAPRNRFSPQTAKVLEVDQQPRSPIEIRLNAIEKISPGRRGKSSTFIPIRFFAFNNISSSERMLLALDALALTEMLGRPVKFGKIIHGDEHSTIKINTTKIMSQVRHYSESISTLLSQEDPPQITLIHHCAECQFRTYCHEIAVEKDDLSLLSNMSVKERQKLNEKGIFTVTQLSYTFRPRRRAKSGVDKPEKFHQSLRALSIRENKIHVSGRAVFEFEGTPVYLDVEGLPDRDFYYLIGFRIGSGQNVKFQSLWANKKHDEVRIWQQFLRILSTIDRPQIIHYGSYESRFFDCMRARYAYPTTGCQASFILDHAINLVSVIYAKIYFPTFSNGLKEIGQKLGCRWTDSEASGSASIVWREQWEAVRSNDLRQKLILYNAEDCFALAVVTDAVRSLCEKKDDPEALKNEELVNIDLLKREKIFHFGRNDFMLPALEQINKAGYWDYQRTRIVLRTDKKVKQAAKKLASNNYKRAIKINKTIRYFNHPDCCPRCHDSQIEAHRLRSKVVIDLALSRAGIKRWIVRHLDRGYICLACRFLFYPGDRPALRSKYGWGLRSYIIYQLIELRMPGTTVSRGLNQLFGLNIPHSVVPQQKTLASNFYEKAYNKILGGIINGALVHADETRVTFDRAISYVWVFANHNSVAYRHTDTRDGEMVQELLRDYKGVLVTDFYSAYDSIECPQQKCLIHLIRDLNSDSMKHPFNAEMASLVKSFSVLLKSIIDTVDHYGLKSRFLRKHKREVGRFFKTLSAELFTSELAKKYQKRFIKNSDKLFTFLDYDNVPWNNNNAEHAIKPFAVLRHNLAGLSTSKGIREYLILLSIEETCKYRGINFLDFLLSEQDDVDTFAAMPRSRLHALSCIAPDA